MIEPGLEFAELGFREFDGRAKPLALEFDVSGRDRIHIWRGKPSGDDVNRSHGDARRGGDALEGGLGLD